jgi:glycosyltransferase involved in cell wall biosynthesis
MRAGTDEQIRVLVLIDSLTLGGAEALLVDLAQAAPSAGIVLDVGYLREVDGSPIADRLRAVGIEPIHVGAEPGLHPRSLQKVRRLVGEVNPSIIHTHLDTADMLGAAAGAIERVPSIATIHLIPAPMRAQLGRSRIRDILRRRLAFAVRTHITHRVICVSEAARSAYLEVSGDKAEHVVTVHNGVHRSVGGPMGKFVRGQMGIRDDEVVITMVSVLREGKGHAHAAAAFREVLAGRPQLRLVVVGDGPMRPEVEKILRPLAERAIFAGYREDVMAILAASDVLIHPTEGDAFPTALLESAAAAVPVIASRVGGIPEIVIDGKTGLLVDDPHDIRSLALALESLVAHPARRLAMGIAARERFDREFASDVWARNLARTYEEIISETRARSRRK